jgi:putative ABC transport system permease protein
VKYFPLVWSALWRTPAESLLTWLAVTVAFALFGLMIGANQTYQRVIDSARMDRLYVNSGGGDPLPIGLRQQLLRFDGVSGVGSFSGLDGYYQYPQNHAYVYAVDAGMRQGWSELPVSSAQWDQLSSRPSGLLVSQKLATQFNLKAGDALPIVSQPGLRADGDAAWRFEVLAVIPEVESFETGVMIGNYGYIDNARPLGKQGIVWGFRLAVKDPSRAAAIANKIDRYFANSATPTLTVPARIAAENMAHSTMDMATKTLFIAGAGLFMVLFVTANGIAQSVRDRIPEFAVLQTIGFRHSGIVALVFAEAAAQCLPGAILGMAVATILARWPLRFLPSQLAGMPTPTLSLMVFSWALVFAVLLAFVSSAIPAYKLRDLSVTDALAGR